MRRILIADDHDSVRSGLRAVLEQRSDWKVVAEAADGRKALEAALGEQPDVAILDFSLPRMTGVEVARRICVQGDTAVLIFTAHASPMLAQERSRPVLAHFWPSRTQTSCCWLRLTR
jgi:DNA-binding NarL/FixJ family response regulator